MLPACRGFGRFVELRLVPERDFAVVSDSNAGPHGIPGNRAVVRFVLEHYLGLVDRDPEDCPSARLPVHRLQLKVSACEIS